jgi:DUF1707 SHOCT-like domain/Cell wall-active antibiotics response LiaF, C-terminal
VNELPEVLASDAEREGASKRLRDAAAEGRLTLEEFTERLDRTYAARTRAELAELTSDLPAAASAQPAPVRAATRARKVVAVFGNTERRGRWRVGERTRCVTFAGNAKIDLRDAILEGPDATIDVFCAMGNLELIVPEGVDVDLDVFAVLGNKTDKRRGAPHPEAPVVRVEGVVVMGNVTVRGTGGERKRILPPPPGLPPPLS